MKEKIDFVTSLAPGAIRTATPTTVGVDLAGFNAAVCVIQVGAVTDGTHTPVLHESDDNSSFSAVAAADLNGSFTALAANTNQRVGYIGRKRYIKPVITVTGSPSTGAYYSAGVIRGECEKQPVA
jgi:hypothetical protein